MSKILLKETKHFLLYLKKLTCVRKVCSFESYWDTCRQALYILSNRLTDTTIKSI